MQLAPGKTMILVTGIIMVVFASIGLLLSLLALLGAGIIANAGFMPYITDLLPGNLIEINMEFVAGIVTTVSVVLLLMSAFQLVVGILSITYRGRIEKANVLFVLAIIMIVFTGIFVILSIDIISLMLLALPVLLLIGAIQNKKAFQGPPPGQEYSGQGY